MGDGGSVDLHSEMGPGASLRAEVLRYGVNGRKPDPTRRVDLDLREAKWLYGYTVQRATSL